jgi:hypothetical protein
LVFRKDSWWRMASIDKWFRIEFEKQLKYRNPTKLWGFLLKFHKEFFSTNPPYPSLIREGKSNR